MELTRLRGAALRVRRADFQIVFQDPYASLNPRMRVHDILMEGMTALGVLASRPAREARVLELLDHVGLPATRNGAIRTSSRAGSASASRSRARSR